MLLVHGSSEMLKYVGQQRNVRQKIVIEILFQILNPEMRPGLLGAIIVFLFERLVF